jgi:addiction module RelE/StbE family toxin
MLKLRINPVALQDLKEIKAYINDALCNPDAALKVVSGIVKTYESLAEMPFTGKKLSAVIDVETDFRYSISGSYLIFYRVDSEYVSIYRILYGRRDYARILFGALPDEETEG